VAFRACLRYMHIMGGLSSYRSCTSVIVVICFLLFILPHWHELEIWLFHLIGPWTLAFRELWFLVKDCCLFLVWFYLKEAKDLTQKLPNNLKKSIFSSFSHYIESELGFSLSNEYVPVANNTLFTVSIPSWFYFNCRLDNKKKM
jgi:hypothetical protein